MRVNIYSQELTNEVEAVSQRSNIDGRVYSAARIFLHSSDMLHHPVEGLDDDRSAVTFWLPRSKERRESMAKAFEEMAEIFRTARSD